MKSKWFTIKVLPGHEARVRDRLIARFREAEMFARVALPTTLMRTPWVWRGRGVYRYKARPGFLFVDFGGDWPDDAMEILESVRGVGAVDSRNHIPREVSAEVGYALEHAPHMRGVI